MDVLQLLLRSAYLDNAIIVCHNTKVGATGFAPARSNEQRTPIASRLLISPRSRKWRATNAARLVGCRAKAVQ